MWALPFYSLPHIWITLPTLNDCAQNILLVRLYIHIFSVLWRRRELELILCMPISRTPGWHGYDTELTLRQHWTRLNWDSNFLPVVSLKRHAITGRLCSLNFQQLSRMGHMGQWGGQMVSQFNHNFSLENSRCIQMVFISLKHYFPKLTRQKSLKLLKAKSLFTMDTNLYIIMVFKIQLMAS